MDPLLNLQKEVIDWPMALEQCGDDPDFLAELLTDLAEELTAQHQKIEAQLSHGIPDYVVIRQAAHIVKGAAANLMCHELRDTAHHLEEAARAKASYIDVERRSIAFATAAQNFMSARPSLK